MAICSEGVTGLSGKHSLRLYRYVSRQIVEALQRRAYLRRASGRWFYRLAGQGIIDVAAHQQIGENLGVWSAYRQQRYGMRVTSRFITRCPDGARACL